MWKKFYAVQRAATEAAANIRAKAEAERARKERAEAEERAKVEVDMKEMAEKTRKAREAKDEAEDDFSERSWAWDEAKAKEKVYIVRLADEATEKAEFEARARNNAKIVNRVAVEAATKIRASDEIQGANRKRAEDDIRSKTKGEMWEKTEKTRKANEAKEKSEDDNLKMARAWAES